MERNRFSKFRIRCCSYKRHKTGQPFMSTINNDVWHDLLENKARYVHAHVSTVASKTRIASNFLLGHSSRAEFGGGEILLEIKLIDQFHEYIPFIHFLSHYQFEDIYTQNEGLY